MSIRPYGTPDKNWSLELVGNDQDQGSRLHYEWVALGFTERDFLGRSSDPVMREIAELESRQRSPRDYGPLD